MSPEAPITEVKVPFRTPKGWRWNVDRHWPIEGAHRGVYDSRRHLDSQFGYARTRIGAWLQIKRALEANR